MYYTCQHDGHSKPHRATSEPARKTNVEYKRGNLKTGKFCLARMMVKIKNCGETSVMIILKVLCNTQFQPILKSIKVHIAAKLAIDVPAQRVYRDFRLNLGNREQRDENETAKKSFNNKETFCQY